MIQIFKPWRWGKSRGTEKPKIAVSRRRRSHLAKCGLKKMHRREMGDREVFLDYFLDELGWKYRHMDLKTEHAQESPSRGL